MAYSRDRCDCTSSSYRRVTRESPHVFVFVDDRNVDGQFPCYAGIRFAEVDRHDHSDGASYTTFMLTSSR